jgi:4'-phosphopantetheinyl transferase
MSETRPALPGVCQVWWATLADSQPELERLLTVKDLARRSRFRSPIDRDRCLIGIALSRLVISATLRCSPQSIRIDRTCSKCGEPHGKPRSEGVEFSISHSGDLIAVAVTIGTPVGIDVQQLVRPSTVELLASKVLAPDEYRVVQSLPNAHRSRAFTRYWTRKEALTKAIGEGLREPIRTIRVTPPDSAPALLAWPDREELLNNVSLQVLRIGPGYEACLAAVGPARMHLHQFDARRVLLAAAGA